MLAVDATFFFFLSFFLSLFSPHSALIGFIIYAALCILRRDAKVKEKKKKRKGKARVLYEKKRKIRVDR